MTPARWRSLLATACLAVTSAVAAQPAPAIRPLHDVVVTYVLDGQAPAALPGGIPGPVTLSWDAGGQRLRAEANGRSQVALIDLRNKSGQAVDTALRVVLPLPIRPKDLRPLLLDGTRLQLRGTERVAGLSCTTYAFESAHEPGTVCLTPDGVPLRGEGTVRGKHGRFTATAVRYGSLPAELFAVPSGYMALGDGRGGAHGLAGLAQGLGGRGGFQGLGELLGRAR